MIEDTRAGCHLLRKAALLTRYAMTTPIAGNNDRARQPAVLHQGGVRRHDAQPGLATAADRRVRYTRQDLDYNGCLAVENQLSATTYAGTIWSGAELAPIAPLAASSRRGCPRSHGARRWGRGIHRRRHEERRG